MLKKFAVTTTIMIASWGAAYAYGAYIIKKAQAVDPTVKRPNTLKEGVSTGKHIGRMKYRGEL